MKRIVLLLLVALGSVAGAQPVPPGGLRSVSHDSTLTGAGSLASVLGLAPCGSPGQTWIWNGTAFACGTAGGGGVTSTGTTGNLALFTSSTAIGNYAGSAPTACSAGNVLTQVVEAATGALTLTCTPIGSQGGMTGTGTTGNLVAWNGTTSTTNFAGSSPSACSAGQVLTQVTSAATGALSLTCTAIGAAGGVTGTGTANSLTRFTGTTATGNANASDDLTTFTIASGTPAFTVTESTARTQINSGASPGDAQLTLRANSTGALSLLSFAADNEQINFDYERVGGSQIARNTSVGMFGKTTGMFRWTGKTGATVNGAVTPTEIAALDLGTGNLEIMGSYGCGELTNALATCKFNSVGYNNGTTQFRDFEIDDGKGAQAFYLTGSTKSAAFSGPLNADSGNISLAGTSGTVSIGAGTGAVTIGTTASGSGAINLLAPTVQFGSGAGATASHWLDRDGTSRPTVANCGTSPTVVGNDDSGYFTTTATPTGSCSLTFKSSGANTDCQVWAMNGSTVTSLSTYTVSTTGIANITGGAGALPSGITVHWRCADH